LWSVEGSFVLGRFERSNHGLGLRDAAIEYRD
jgi:hypothetical protein